jgi:hypothetical protein
VNATLATGIAALSWRGRLVMVGAGGGSAPFDFFKVPPGAQLMTSLNGGSIALQEVVGMASLGRLKTLVDRYPLSAAKQAYDDSSTVTWSVGRCSCPHDCKVLRAAQPRRHPTGPTNWPRVSTQAGRMLRVVRYPYMPTDVDRYMHQRSSRLLPFHGGSTGSNPVGGRQDFLSFWSE